MSAPKADVGCVPTSTAFPTVGCAFMLTTTLATKVRMYAQPTVAA